MALKNLEQLAMESMDRFLEYQKEEVRLNYDFKSLYSEIVQTDYNERVFFGHYTTIVETSTKLTITFPNQWFYIASYFVDFLKALKEFKAVYQDVFQEVDNSAEIVKAMKTTGEVPEGIKGKISHILTQPSDREYFVRFISDYSWWHGSKTIDRGDYYVSPILNLARVVNVTQSYIADLALRLTNHPDLLKLLQDSKLSSTKPKEVLTVTNDFSIMALIEDVEGSGLFYSSVLIGRLIASLLTKPFAILTGLSGSGKTKLAQAFVKWICQDDEQYKIVPVGADWTNREPLLGYPNALNPQAYVKPDTGVLDLMIRARSQPDLPHFLILDEMNLSHVERYFADFLSVMESKKEIQLHSGEIDNGVPSKLELPSNLFIIGTVNIDETTNMFSPKVLDRANTIEFRVTKDEMKSFLANIKDIDMKALTGKGAGMAKSFLNMAADNSFAVNEEINEVLVKFFGELSKTGAEFGYRSASEILRLIHQLSVLDEGLSIPQKIDIAIMQKLLPKLHGSQRRVSSTLKTLGSFCVSSSIDIEDIFLDENFDYNRTDLLYPLSLEKIARMYRGALANGFTSFAEA